MNHEINILVLSGMYRCLLVPFYFVEIYSVYVVETFPVPKRHTKTFLSGRRKHPMCTFIFK